MSSVIKHTIKKALASMGFIHPALGVKIGGEAKAAILLEHKNPKMHIFVETGTEYGAMIERVYTHFQQIYSIEYNEEFYKRAVELFKGKKNIKLFHGDSSVEIKNVLTELKEPALFWLDTHGHGSMSITNPLHCPVEKELIAIFEHSIKGHVIIIDDARHFDRYSISVIRQLAQKNGYAFEVRDGLFILKRK